MSIKDHRELIRRAYYATSFNPDRKADMIIQDYTPEYESLDSEKKKEKYLKYFLAWMNAESRCMSAMITGPANFPTYKNQKNLRYAMSAYDKFRAFVEKINHVRIKTLSPEEDLEEMIKKHENLRANHEKMKAINKILRSKGENKIDQIMEILDVSRVVAEKVGYAQDYMLRNNLANIKRVEQRIIELKKRIEIKTDFDPIEFNGGRIEIINDRVCIFHNEKPSTDVISKIKSKGFRWSPRFKNWCRKHTARALEDAKRIVL